MIDKDTLKAEIARECDIIRHLASKVPAGTDDWRPTPGQRSVLEFLRYVSFCGLGGGSAAATGGWDGYKAAEAEAELVTRETFDAAMERQKVAIGALLDGISDEDWATKQCALPWGEKVPLWRGLFEMSYRWLAGYRMQLFLYAKGAGNADVGTPNVWVGIDWEPPAAQ